MSFIRIPDPTTDKGRKRILFEYDPGREIVRIRVRGKDIDVDLRRYKAQHQLESLSQYESVDQAKVGEFMAKIVAILDKYRLSDTSV